MKKPKTRLTKHELEDIFVCKKCGKFFTIEDVKDYEEDKTDPHYIVFNCPKCGQ